MGHASEPLLEFVRDTVQANRIPGLSVAVRVADEIGTAAAGTCDVRGASALSSESRFQVGCLTQLLTAYAVLDLVASDRVGLDDSLGDLLPRTKGSVVGEVTVNDLLAHMTGLQPENLDDGSDREELDRESFFAAACARPSLFARSRVFSASQTSSVFLGQIVESLRGVSCAAFIRQRMLDPLGIRGPGAADIPVSGHSLYWETRTWHAAEPLAISDVWSDALLAPPMSAEEILRLAPFGGPMAALIGERCFALLAEQQITLPPLHGLRSSEEPYVGFGRGIGLYGNGDVGVRSTFQNQTCVLRCNPAGDAVAVCINATDAGLRDKIARHLLTELSAASGNSARPLTVESSTDVSVPEILGEYAADEFCSISIRSAAEGVMVHENPSAVTPRPLGRLELRIEQDATGQWLPAKHCAQAIPYTDVAFFSFAVAREPHTGTPYILLSGRVFQRCARTAPRAWR